VIQALGPACRFTGCLHRRQQEGDQDPDDRDHHQKLDEGKPSGSWIVNCGLWIDYHLRIAYGNLLALATTVKSQIPNQLRFRRRSTAGTRPNTPRPSKQIVPGSGMSVNCMSRKVASSQSVLLSPLSRASVR